MSLVYEQTECKISCSKYVGRFDLHMGSEKYEKMSMELEMCNLIHIYKIWFPYAKLNSWIYKRIYFLYLGIKSAFANNVGRSSHGYILLSLKCQCCFLVFLFCSLVISENEKQYLSYKYKQFATLTLFSNVFCLSNCGDEEWIYHMHAAVLRSMYL